MKRYEKMVGGGGMESYFYRGSTRIGKLVVVIRPTNLVVLQTNSSFFHPTSIFFHDFDKQFTYYLLLLLFKMARAFEKKKTIYTFLLKKSVSFVPRCILACYVKWILNITNCFVTLFLFNFFLRDIKYIIFLTNELFILCIYIYIRNSIKTKSKNVQLCNVILVST